MILNNNLSVTDSSLLTKYVARRENTVQSHTALDCVDIQSFVTYGLKVDVKRSFVGIT